MVKISVNILAWNTKHTTQETIQFCHKELKDFDYEIIVVDNGSDDGTKEMLAEELVKADKDNLIIISNRENLGISRGKNQAIDVSRGDYIMMIDGDIVPVENSIRMLMEYMDEHPECFALGFLPNKWNNQRNGNGQKHHEDYCYMLYEPKIHKGACIYYGIHRKEIFEKVRMCEEGAFFGVGYGWEDHYFYRLMKEAGYDQWVCGMNTPIGKYYHEINSSIRNMGRSKYIQLSREREKVYKKRWQN